MLRHLVLALCASLSFNLVTAFEFGANCTNTGAACDPGLLSGYLPRSVLSNAHRLSRGLPLNRPKRLYDGSRTRPHLAKRSAIPPGAVLNIAAARKSAPNTIIGYTAIDGNSPYASGYIDLVTQALGDVFTNIPESGSQTNIQTTACPSYAGKQDWFYGTIDYFGGDLGNGDGAADFTGFYTGHPIWSWDNVPGQVEVEYANSDGTVGHPKLYADPEHGNILFASSSAANVNNYFTNDPDGNQITVTEDDEVILFWKYTL